MPSGRESKIGIIKGATWGTAVACGADNGLLITSESINESVDQQADDSAGQAFISEQDTGQIEVGGNLEAFMRYRGIGLLLALCMGSAGAPSQVDSSTAYLHTLTLADDIEGLFATLALGRDPSSSVHEIASAKIAGFTISGEAGQPLTVSFEVVGDDRVINTSSGTNTTTTIASVTIPDEYNRILFRHGVIRMNAASGAALAGGDVITPNSFELSFKRQVEREYVANGADTTIEPTENGFPEITLTLGFSSYGTDSYLSAIAAGTAQKADLVFTGEEIESGYNYGFGLEFPELVPSSNDGPNVDHANRMTQSITFDCRRAAAAPTGMTGLTNPFRATLTNTLTTDLLA